MIIVLNNLTPLNLYFRALWIVLTDDRRRHGSQNMAWHTLLCVCILCAVPHTSVGQPADAAGQDAQTIQQERDTQDTMENAPLAEGDKREEDKQGNENTASIERFQPDINMTRKHQIMKAFSQEHVQRYQLSGELLTLEANNTPFLAVWEPSRNAAPVGAVLILHGEGQTLDYPEVIGRVRASLPEFGWATLSISIDEMPKKIIPKRLIKESHKQPKVARDAGADDVQSEQDDTADAPQDNQSPDPAENIDGIDNPEVEEQAIPKMTDIAVLMQGQDEQYMQAVLSRLGAGLAFLNEKGQYNIAFVAHGKGAIYATELVKQVMAASSGSQAQPQTEGITTTARALIMINARNQSVSGAYSLPEMLGEDGLPILDVYTNQHSHDMSEPTARLKAAKRAGYTDYYQIDMVNPSANWHSNEDALSRRVRGFLNRFAKGVEIEG